MRVKTHHVLNAFLAILLLLLCSCSTKKKSWMHRKYHNTTAKYNGYFNGKESFKAGVKKLQKKHEDDFTTILPIYQIGDLKKSTHSHSYMEKAIKKSSIVIQKHSIKIKGKEYCKWIDDNYLLVGKSYFYKGEFDEAIKTFLFIKKEYEKSEIYFEASLWLTRSYVEKGDFSSAESELEELKKNRRFPKKLKLALTKVSADFYLQQKNYSLVLDELEKTEKLIKRKSKKARYNYIIAQIYHQNKNYKKAEKYYAKVLKTNAEYEMVFNAKMNLSRTMEAGTRGGEKMRQQLVKMIKDDKNKEYLDQIYFTLAEIDIKKQDTLSATENYLLSTYNSIENNSQKALSFLSLAQIKYNQNNFKLSKTYYDSTIFYMSEDFRLYKNTQQKHAVLQSLVQHLDMVLLQDSLQLLAKLPKQELQATINKIIKKQIEKEREELSRQKEQQLFYNNSNRGESFGNNTSGGKWYFYNPATLSFGMSEFRKKWGKRKLEDDWRRRDKKSSYDFEIDSITKDSLNNVLENKKDPNYYLSKIPKTEEDFIKSNLKIKESLYQIGTIYRDDLEKYQLSSKYFKEITKRYFLDAQYSSLSYYNIYTNYIKENNVEKAEEIKKELLQKYPNSFSAKLLQDPSVKQEIVAEKNKEEIQYQGLYQNYLKEEYDIVLSKTNKIEENKYKSKKRLLRAFSFAQKRDTLSLSKELEKLIKSTKDTSVLQEVKYVFNVLKDPSKMLKSNEFAIAASPYLFKPNSKHYFVLLLNKKGVDINYLKTIISDYHVKDFPNETFDIAAILMGNTKHLLIIKTFANALETQAYSELFYLEQPIKKILHKKQHETLLISEENFRYFYKNKDTEGYKKYFQNKYLNKN